jgi:hypothetical protein
MLYRSQKQTSLLVSRSLFGAEVGKRRDRKMNQLEFRGYKQNIRNYIRTKDDYTLAALTATAKDGKLKFSDRCGCIRGICGGGTVEGYQAENSSQAVYAEVAMMMFGVGFVLSVESDTLRNRIIYAICRAEQKRREWAKEATLSEQAMARNNCR